MQPPVRIILASRSPRRRELLDSIGIDFEVRTSDIPEVRAEGELVAEYVERLSAEKAAAVARHEVEAWVIAADTVVFLDGQVLEKPRDRQEAIEMLEKLAGTTHTVYSGVALTNRMQGLQMVESVSTDVVIMPLDRSFVEWYVDTGEPMDKAGAYAVQGLGALFVESVTGSYTNVVGLPLPTLFRMMMQAGISPVQTGITRSRG